MAADTKQHGLIWPQCQ